METLHDDELRIDVDLVRRLVAGSLPEYADRVVEPAPGSGSTNVLVRLGDDLLVRLPRQPGGSAAIRKEARWLPMLAPRLSTAVPEVLSVRAPGPDYPEHWSVTRWIDGEVPGRDDRLAGDLARFVTDLRGIDVPEQAREDETLRWYRAGPLADVDDSFRAALRACAHVPGLDLDLHRVTVVWEEALAAERTAAPRGATWVHADLLAENLLVRDGALAAVLDFGALCVGDPTVDLVVAWDVLGAAGREAFRAAVGADDATWLRAQGWAVFLAIITFPYYWHTMPSRCARRRALASAVLEENP